MMNSLALIGYVLAWTAALLHRSGRFAIARETPWLLLGFAACLGLMATARAAAFGLAEEDRIAAHPLNVLASTLNLLGVHVLAWGLGVALLCWDSPRRPEWSLALLALAAIGLASAEFFLLETSDLWWLIFALMTAIAALSLARGWISPRRAAATMVAALWLPLGWRYLCVVETVPAILSELGESALVWHLARGAQLMLIFHGFAVAVALPRLAPVAARSWLVAAFALEVITVGELASRWATNIAHGSVEGWLAVVLDMAGESVLATGHAIGAWILLFAVARTVR